MLSKAQEHYREPALWLAAKLREDFPFGRMDVAAILGNGGHESAGLTKLQEMKPVVPGSRGGYGLMQWTGPRRRKLEAYCARNDYNPADYKAQYKWLFLELKGSEKSAIAAVKNARTLADKVVAFERSFLRAGIKHYDSRYVWARFVYELLPAEAPQPEPNPLNSAIENLPWIQRQLARWALKLLISQIENRAKENKSMNILSGYKTYIVAIMMVLTAGAQFLGVEVPNFDGQNAGNLLMEGFAILFLRKGLKTP